jgi:Icc-related predicted phosphoesterase
MRIVCISDTHDIFRDLTVPDGDLLLHGGDLSRLGKVTEVTATADWLRSLPHRHKVVIAGNHDLCMLEVGAREMLSGLTYLEDESCEIEGLKIFGSPWSPAHGYWAFQAERGAALRECWQRIPLDSDILITHGPPLGILDAHQNGKALGCDELLARVREVQPLLHLFGHVHESHGIRCSGDGLLPDLAEFRTVFVNASSSSVGYKYTQPPVVFDFEEGRLKHIPSSAESPKPLVSHDLWEELVALHGAPREFRSLSSDEQQSERAAGHVFWLEVHSDGFGSGHVIFRPTHSDDNLADRGPDHLHRRWVFTMGVTLKPEWMKALSRTDWERYSEVPHLPA